MPRPLLLLLAVLFAGCASTPPPPQSAWGDVITIAQAEQMSAPALWEDGQRLTAAWIGADESGVHHDARVVDAGGALTPGTILPLPPARPHRQTLLPAADGLLHLMWIDANPAGENRLYSALLTPDLRVERGPVEVSSAPTYAYAALPAADGGLWTAWSGGLLAEPSLYLQAIDPAGRPLPALQAAANAHHPVLITAGAEQHLFWISGDDGQVMLARLADGVLIERIVITSAPYLAPSDRLDGMAAGVDSSHTYLFWNITRAGRTPETWFSAAGQAAGQWTAPRKLSLALSAETTAIAGFDAPPLHTAQLAEADGWTARWAAPAAGYGAELPVGLETDEGLAVVWFEQGAPAAYQLVVPEARLIGPPLLLADAQGALTLTWAQPYADRPADLNLTSTQWAAGASRR